MVRGRPEHACKNARAQDPGARPYLLVVLVNRLEPAGILVAVRDQVRGDVGTLLRLHGRRAHSQRCRRDHRHNGGQETRHPAFFPFCARAWDSTKGANPFSGQLRGREEGAETGRA